MSRQSTSTTPAAAPAPSPDAFLATRHGSLAWTSMGAGPPLILLPANGHDARDFDAVRPTLAEAFETIAIDWPSMGASPPLDRPPAASAALFADMLEDVVAELARPDAILMGHSVGGFAAARAAARMPERIRGLVLIDTGGFAPVGIAGRLFCRVKGTAWVTGAIEARFARRHSMTRNEHVAAMIARIERARRDRAYAATVAGVWRSFARPEHDLRGEAAAIRCPTLVVWGARDPVLPIERAGAPIAALVAGAERVVLDTGHSPFVEDPHGFTAAVAPFLRALI